MGLQKSADRPGTSTQHFMVQISPNFKSFRGNHSKERSTMHFIDVLFKKREKERGREWATLTIMAQTQREVNYIDWRSDIKCFPFGSRLVMPSNVLGFCTDVALNITLRGGGGTVNAGPVRERLRGHPGSERVVIFSGAGEEWYIDTAGQKRAT